MLDDSSLVIVSRLLERLVVALSGVILIYIGYQIAKKRPVATSNSSIDLTLSKWISAKLTGQGPGIYCILFGAALLVVTAFNTVKVHGEDFVLFDRHDVRGLQAVEAMKVVQSLQGIRTECQDPNYSNKNEICKYVLHIINRIVHSDLENEYQSFISMPIPTETNSIEEQTSYSTFKLLQFTFGGVNKE